MSAGDRGGVGALNAVIKKSKVPIIAIANDAKSQKMKPLLNTTFQMLFKRCVDSRPRSRSGASFLHEYARCADVVSESM